MTKVAKRIGLVLLSLAVIPECLFRRMTGVLCPEGNPWYMHRGAVIPVVVHLVSQEFEGAVRKY